MVLRGINNVKNSLSAAEVALDAVNVRLWCLEELKYQGVICTAWLRINIPPEMLLFSMSLAII